jgi:hypothetical protein
MMKRPNNTLRTVIRLAVTATCLFVLTLAVQGQGPGGDGDLEDNPDTVPIDGGLSLLLAAGAAYGGKKLYDQRKKGKEE